MKLTRSLVVIFITLFSYSFAAQITLYKSPTCGCCSQWAELMETHGHTIDVKHPINLDKTKEKLGMPAQLGSCHTAEINGFLFEGHIPVEDIEAFLANPPEGAKGLAVPGMPMMSPGMAPEGETYRDFNVIGFDEQGKFFLYRRY